MAAVEELVSPAFQVVLERQREAFNQLCQAAPFPSLRLRHFLLKVLQPMLLALEPLLPQVALEQQALAFFQLDLQLQQLGLPAERQALLHQQWLKLCQQAGRCLLPEPVMALKQVTHLCLHLFEQPGAFERWQTAFSRWLPHCQQPADFFQLAQLLAWQAGLAQYRLSVLRAAHGLSASLQAAFFGGHSLQRWLQNPWQSAEPGEPQLQIVASLGAFKGWGGHLLEPPELAWQGDLLLIQDSQQSWQVAVDRWGAHWLRSPQRFKAQQMLADWQLSPEGDVSLGAFRGHFPQLAGWRQAVGNSHSLAVAMPHSFKVLLLGLSA